MVTRHISRKKVELSPVESEELEVILRYGGKCLQVPYRELLNLKADIQFFKSALEVKVSTKACEYKPQHYHWDTPIQKALDHARSLVSTPVEAVFSKRIHHPAQVWYILGLDQSKDETPQFVRYNTDYNTIPWTEVDRVLGSDKRLEFDKYMNGSTVTEGGVYPIDLYSFLYNTNYFD